MRQVTTYLLTFIVWGIWLYLFSLLLPLVQLIFVLFTGGIPGPITGGASDNSASFFEFFTTIFLAIVFIWIRKSYIRKTKKENFFRDLVIVISVISFFFIPPFIITNIARASALTLAQNDKILAKFEWPDYILVTQLENRGRCESFCQHLLFKKKIKGFVTAENSRSKENTYKVFKVEKREVCSKPDFGFNMPISHLQKHVALDYAELGLCLVSESYAGQLPRTEILVTGSTKLDKKSLTRPIYKQYQIKKNNKVVAQKTDYAYRAYYYPFVSFSNHYVTAGLSGYSNRRTVQTGLSRGRIIPNLTNVLELVSRDDARDYHPGHTDTLTSPNEVNEPETGQLLDKAIKEISNIGIEDFPLSEIRKKQVSRIREYLKDTPEVNATKSHEAKISLFKLEGRRLKYCYHEREQRQCSTRDILFPPISASLLKENADKSTEVRLAADLYHKNLLSYLEHYSVFDKPPRPFYRGLSYITKLKVSDSKLNRGSTDRIWEICFLKAPTLCKPLIKANPLEHEHYLDEILAKLKKMPSWYEFDKKSRIRRTPPPNARYLALLSMFSNDLLNPRYEEIANLINEHYSAGDLNGAMVEGDITSLLIKFDRAALPLYKKFLDAEMIFLWSKRYENSKKMTSQDRRVYRHERIFIEHLFTMGCKQKIALSDAKHDKLETMFLEHPGIIGRSYYSLSFFMSYLKAVGRLDSFEEKLNIAYPDGPFVDQIRSASAVYNCRKPGR